MAAGSSRIMIDALVWHSGLLLRFGSCLDKQVHKTSHSGRKGRLAAGKHQSLLSEKSGGTGHICFSIAGRVFNRTKMREKEKAMPAIQIKLYRATTSSHSSNSLH